MTTVKTVLLIDDDADFRASLRQVLQREGYVVVEAASGAEGLLRLKQHEPDVIVLDVMPETVEEGYRVNEAILPRFLEALENVTARKPEDSPQL